MDKKIKPEFPQLIFLVVVDLIVEMDATEGISQPPGFTTKQLELLVVTFMVIKTGAIPINFLSVITTQMEPTNLVVPLNLPQYARKNALNNLAKLTTKINTKLLPSTTSHLKSQKSKPK